MTYDDDSIDWNTVPPAKMLHMVMQEIVDTRNELKQDFRAEIAALDHKLSNRIDRVEKTLGGRIGALASELHTLRLEVHQNHSTFIANQVALEKRVKVLEMAA